MQNTTTIAPRRRPLGVTIIAIFTALQGVFLLLISGATFLLFLGALWTHQALPSFAHAAIIGVLSGVLVIIALLSLFVAWGLWTLKRWAFWVTIVIQIFSLVSSLSLLNQTGNSTTTSTTSNIVFALVILIYMFADRNVRAAFNV